MKKINEKAVPLLAAFILALCSCQSSDNVSGPARVKEVSLKAGMPATGSRTTMTDTYGGAFTETWNKDVLSIYHPYLKNGVAQGLMPLDFTTTATCVTNAVFCYLGLSDYAYNPSKSFYAFNKLAGGGQSTPSLTGVAANPLSLSLTGWTNQNGMLTGTQNVALYDAMAGCATTDAKGVPSALAMKHLGGILNFHLTCTDFTDGTAINNMAFTTKGSDNTTSMGFFPSSATASIASDGTCTFTTTPSLVSSWNPSGSFIPVSKAIDVYLSSFPVSNIASGSLLIYARDANNSYGVGMTISNFSLSPGKVKCIPLTLTKIPVSTVTPTSYSKVYAWDAPLFVTVGSVPTNANSVTATDYLNYASNSCKNCPNANEITWYLKGGCYWDNGTSNPNGFNATSYTMAGTYNGASTTKAGMWFLKKCFIDGFSSTTSSGVESCTPALLSSMTAAQISALNLSTYYFFLPAAGYTDCNNGAFGGGWPTGYYWSSTPLSDTTGAYSMYINNTTACLYKFSRAYGFCLWQAQ